RDAPAILFDGDDPPGAFLQQRPGEPAGAGAHFHDHVAFQRRGGAGNPPGQVEIEQEVLAETLAGGKTVARDHLPQRRQRSTQAAARRAAASSRAMRSVSLSAAMRLDGSAMLPPAMSSAVP